MLDTVLSFIGLFLSGYSVYQGSNKQEPDVVKFVGNWGHIIEELKFCKKLHNVFQEFDRDLNQYLVSLDGIKADELEQKWIIIRNFYEQTIDEDLNIEDKIKRKQEIIHEINWTSQIPITIKDNVEYINRFYPQLISDLKAFRDAYHQQNDSIKEIGWSTFQVNNKNIEKHHKRIFRRADGMIFNLVPIMTFNYDSLPK